jgi:hypothetical protein
MILGLIATMRAAQGSGERLSASYVFLWKIGGTMNGLIGATKAAEFRIKAEDAKRRAKTAKTEREKLAHLRRQEDFEKLASDEEKT